MSSPSSSAPARCRRSTRRPARAGLWERAEELEGRDLSPVLSEDSTLSGAGQAIIVAGEALAGGSDARRDGYAAGL
jgi:gamma-glutamyltranspeptidase